MNKSIRGMMAVLLIAVIPLCGYYVSKIQNEYAAGVETQEEMIVFKPELPAAIETHTPEISVPPASNIQEPPPAEEEAWAPPFVNQSILDLQNQYKGVIGWITVPHTGIDYPFVQGGDNDFYLSNGIDGGKAKTGTVFMDYRNYRDFRDSNIILYGHNMKNSTMFSTLKRFGDQDFFEANQTGTIFLADRTYTAEFFAFLVIRSDDKVIYGMNDNAASAAAFLEYIHENARYYRDSGIAPEDSFVTLSTCAYEFTDARMVLIGRLTQSQ